MGYNDEFASSVVFDLETVGSPACADFLDPVQAPANYKDADKIALYCAEKRAKQINEAALEPDLCEVVAIGWRTENGQERALTRAESDERNLLHIAWGAIEGHRVVGFNVLGFDLPVLIRRSQLLNVPFTLPNLDRYRTPHIDLLERLSFNGKLTYRSLNFYCRRFGIPISDPTTGAEIAGLVANNEWTAVQTHVASDVSKTAQLAARLGWFVQHAMTVEAVA